MLPKDVTDHCKSNRVRWVFETDEDVEFSAPMGWAFSSGSRRRILPLDEIESRYALDLLSITKL